MKDWQHRVINERDDLYEKLESLSYLVDKGKSFHIDDENWNLLLRQRVFMAR